MLTGSRVSHPVARLRYGWLIHWVPTCIAEGQVVEADVAIQWGRSGLARNGSVPLVRR